MPDSGRSPASMKALLRVFPAAHLVISVLFVLAALGLLCFSGHALWSVVAPAEGVGAADRLGHVLDALASLTIAVAARDLAQTIVEEDDQREAPLSAPTRARRSRSRSMGELSGSLSIPLLVAVSHVRRDQPANSP